VVYLILAALFFLLGAIGVILPGVPTTPFLLLTSYFLVRSWPRLNDALLRSRLFGPILRDWQQHRGVRPHIKLRASIFVAVVVGASIYFSGMPPVAAGLVVLCASVGIGVIWRLPSIR